MKKIIISLSVGLLMVVVGAQSASAQWIVFDPAAQTTRVVQLAKEIFTAGTTLATQINTYKTMYLDWVLNPIANGMIAASLLSQQQGTINLVTGALGGSQPLLQSNPDQWIKNQGLNAVRVNLSDISSVNGLFSSSILSNLVGNYRASSDIKTQLQALSQSSIPNLVQNNVCRDANLTSIATNDIVASTGSADPNAVNIRKNELWSSLCSGNPQNDPNLARRLAQVQSQRPDVVGDDALYAYLAGDNAYARSVRSAVVVAQNKKDKEDSAKSELEQGGGVISPSKCGESVTIATDFDIGTIANAPCRLRELTGSGAQIQSAFQQAFNIPMQKLIASDGWGILDTLGTFLSAKNSYNAMRDVMGFGGSSSGTNTGTTGSSSSQAPDLANNADLKKSITDPIETRLSNYSTALDSLQAADAQLNSEITTAENNLTSMKNCYDSLNTDFPDEASGSSAVNSAISYYQSHMLALASERAKTSGDATAIASARTGVTSLRSLISSSNSSEQIRTAENDFEAKVTNGTYPADTAYAERQGDYLTLQGENQISTMQQGDLYNLNSQCTQLRQQFTRYHDN